ncbi:MAG: hypothetical protein Q6J68_06275 [Thermostichales cyanobacterium SZTDM-1c_bins_54]
MAALVVVALIVAGVFWYATRTTLFGDPPSASPPTPGIEAPMTPVPLQRLDQVREDLQQSLEAAQEQRNQVQQQLEQP